MAAINEGHVVHRSGAAGWRRYQLHDIARLIERKPSVRLDRPDCGGSVRCGRPDMHSEPRHGDTRIPCSKFH